MTSDKPRASVIIPSYNHALYLPAAIESVLSQSEANLELIIVDDGSTDNSWELIERASKEDRRIRAIAQRNQGAHAAINVGLREASGDFLAILNSDDLFHPDRIAALLAHADAAEGKDFLLTSVQLIDQNGTPISDHPWLDEYAAMRRRAAQDGVLAALLERNFAISTSNFFFRRSVYEALGGIRPFRYTMDWDYALRALFHAPDRFAWLTDLNLLKYRLHGSNTILQGLPLSALEANHIINGALQQHFKVPTAALAGLRRHHRLVRRQQATKVARTRDSYWEALLQDAHQGWKATRQEADETHNRLGAALSQRDAALAQRDAALADREAALADIAAIRSSRSYRLGHFLTSPARWARAKFGSHFKSQTGLIPQRENTERKPFRRVALPSISSHTPQRIAVHVHVHYIDTLPELLVALENIPTAFDLFVTTTNSLDEVRAIVTERLPHAHVQQYPNQGKDIGPFLEVLNRHELDRYDLVLKLHGKKSRNDPGYLKVIRALFGNDIADGDDWRRKLIAPIAGSPDRIGQILQAFAEDPELGMLGAAKFICTAPDANADAYSNLCRRLEISREVRFFGGTMFWVRGSILTGLRRAGITQKDFDSAQTGAVENTLEHSLERVFGTLTTSQGYYVGGVDDLPGQSLEK